jgi:hypothetical protein
MNLEELDEDFMKFVLFVLNYGIKSVRDLEGPFIPSVSVEDEAGKRHLHPFMADRREHAVDEAMVFADSVDTQSRVAVSYDGSVMMGDAAMDAIVVVARDRGSTEAQVRVAQCYKPKKPGHRFSTVGSPVFLGRPSQG